MKATGKRRGRPPAPPGTARTRRVSLRLHPVLVARVEREVALMALTSLSSFFELAAANFIEQRTTWRRELLTAAPPLSRSTRWAEIDERAEELAATKRKPRRTKRRSDMLEPA